MEAIRVWTYKVASHLGHPEGKSVGLGNPPQRGAHVGNHEARSYLQKLGDVCLSNPLCSMSIHRAALSIPKFGERRACDDPLSGIHILAGLF
ncbi:hypothetical protein ACVSQB_09015 [Bradyrhizobium elkanii]